MIEMAFAVFVLVAPLDVGWGWFIVGGPFESATECEMARSARLDGDRVLCSRLR